MSNKEIPAKAERSKGIKLQRDTNIHQAGGSSEGVDSDQRFLMSQKGDSDDEDNEQADDENFLKSDDDQVEADDEQTETDNLDDEEETQDDEYVHTPEGYVPTDDETNDDSKEFDEEEYEELYGDVNRSLKDVEPSGKEKVDEEMNVAVTTALTITISSLLSLLFPYLQQLTPIPKPITTEATTSTTVVSDSETLSDFHQRIIGLEKVVKELKTINHSAALLSTIKSEVPNAVKEYLGKNLDDARYKVLKKHDVDIIKEYFVPSEIVERLKQQYVPE
uniref:Uncharacterized protein n=1 Tax=Tanacetum cinerariifolium TaxID=118510 RepID=A0A6L2N4N2_TANCI|nr:hypothetical protein [Tanacetum cinerariifolium]